MIFEVPEAEILRTPIKIEKLSIWNRSRSEFIMNFEFHCFLKVFFSFFLTFFGGEVFAGVVLPGGLRPPGPPHLGLLGQAAWGLSPVGVLWIPFETKKYFFAVFLNPWIHG